MIFLSLADVPHVVERTLGSEVQVRDYGLLESAVVRPQTSVFGEDAYPTLEAKAAALLNSYDFVIAVAVGELSEVEGIADVIRRFTETLASWVSPRSNG